MLFKIKGPFSFFTLNILMHMQSFVGHGDSINEIRTQALKPSLVVSASKVGVKYVWIVLSYYFMQ